jgi:hypothetical protein
MTYPATLTGHPPRPAVAPRPCSNTPVAPPLLWAHLNTRQQHQIAALIAELIRRRTTPLLLHEERTDDHC